MSNRKEVFAVCPRGEGKKDYWLRIGTAFENRDGSWSIVLDALPTNNKLIVREPREEQPQREGRASPPPRANHRAAPPPREEDYGDYSREADDVPF